MKKKNKLQVLAFMLAATLTMALTSPMSAKAEKFEPVSLADRKTESNLYGGMILPQLPVATTATEEYNLVDQSAEPTTEQVRSYYVKNSHGDIIGQVDEYGNLLNSYAYNAFGELVAAVTIQPEKTKNTSRFLYAGEQYDETSGLYYLRARCYDADAGRFTQEDTYLGDGRNLYAYTHSNPLKYVDPSGHFVADCYDNDGDLANDWQEDVSDGANTGYGRTGALSNGRISGGGSKYQVGAYQNIKGTTGLDAHHVGQKAAMKQLVGSYNVKTAPAINVPKVGHTISGPNGIISRSTLGITNARQLLARDLFELKRVYPDIPNSAYQELINMNMNMYPEMRK